MLLGIFFGFLSAFSQSMSYVYSDKFLKEKRSSMQLMVFSQLAMGAWCVLLLPWSFPVELLDQFGTLALQLTIWIISIILGQLCFFSAIKEIPPSQLSSLLGLKVIVVACIYTLFLDNSLAFAQYIAIGISTLAAVMMNYTGGTKFTFKGIVLLLLSLVCYASCDISETILVLMPTTGNVTYNAIRMGITCYALLGVCTLPMLYIYKWNTKNFREAVPFAVTWFGSQVAIFACFGLLGAVFGNVILASRGVISVLLAMIFAFLGFKIAEKEVNKSTWIRRVIVACLMAVGIVIYALGSK